MDDSTLPPEGSIERKRLRFMSKNSDLPWETEEGVRIDIVPAGYPKTGRLKVAIVLDDDTTVRDLADAYRLADQWRSRLYKLQGPWTGGGLEQILERTARWKEGKSYGVIAKWLNKEIAFKVNTIHISAPLLRAEGYGDEYILSQPYNHACQIMQAMGMSPEDAHDYILGAVQDARRGHLEAKPDYPINKDMVKDKLRKWQQRKDRAESAGQKRAQISP